MKLLISAYACAPHHGSEHAVGWNWTTEAHRLGHEVWVLASPVHRDAIEAAYRQDPELYGIHWAFPEVRFWPLQPGVEPRWERTYNLLWQRAALRHARDLQLQVKFDAVHHLTWGGVRAPTFLGSLGPPLILGPLGGGETSPVSLRDGFHFKARVTERLRDLSNATITANPIVRGGFACAEVIFVKTLDTRALLNSSMRERSVPFIELGLNPSQVGRPRTVWQSPPKLLYAGRLLYWKGVHLAIRAFADLAHRMPGARLTIVGKGPDENRLKAQAAAYRLTEKIEFIPWLPQRKLFDLYSSHDLLVFPSLHDSSGGVVLEALSCGLPVICLDLGGPRHIVTLESGVIVRTTGLDTAGVARTMTDEMVRLFAEPARLSSLSEGAIARAQLFILSTRVAQFYGRVAESIGLPNERSHQFKQRNLQRDRVLEPGAGIER